ncbi:MAG: hypothetical protein ACFFD1_14785 [Candidatus Thorarchaeota archaeon]
MYKFRDKYTIISRTFCLRSLLQAVVKAGGCAQCFSVKALKKMSALELIEAIGPNDIRFLLDNPKLNKELLDDE